MCTAADGGFGSSAVTLAGSPASFPAGLDAARLAPAGAVVEVGGVVTGLAMWRGTRLPAWVLLALPMPPSPQAASRERIRAGRAQRRRGGRREVMMMAGIKGKADLTGPPALPGLASTRPGVCAVMNEPMARMGGCVGERIINGSLPFRSVPDRWSCPGGLPVLRPCKPVMAAHSMEARRDGPH